MSVRPRPGALLKIVGTVVLAGFSISAHAKLPANTEIRAYLNESCIVADEPYYQPQPAAGQIEKSLALSGVVVGKIAYALLNGAFRLTAKGLANVSSHKDMYFVSAYDFDMYRAVLGDSPQLVLNGQLGCVTVVAAEFAPTGTDCTGDYQPRTIPAGTAGGDRLPVNGIQSDRAPENVLRRANVCVVGPARSVFESRINLSDDQTAFRLESAGLWINSLLGTNSKRAKRSLIYTVDISAPGDTGNPVGLAVVSVPMGIVKAGVQVTDSELAARSDWTRVPQISPAAYSAYQRDTAVHQDVFAEIRALERSLLRNQRLRDGLTRRQSDASEKVAQLVAKEVEALDLKILRTDALLEARRAEYRDLPDTDRFYMPVIIEVGLIESRSEKRALSTLAGFLDEYSASLAAKATQSAGFERSLEGMDNTDDVSALVTARDAYFDAVIVLQETEDDEDPTAAREALLKARDAYNDARRAAGIPEID